MKLHFHGLDQGLANFFCQEPDNIWGLYGPHAVFGSYSLFLNLLKK